MLFYNIYYNECLVYNCKYSAIAISGSIISDSLVLWDYKTCFSRYKIRNACLSQTLSDILCKYIYNNIY